MYKIIVNFLIGSILPGIDYFKHFEICQRAVWNQYWNWESILYESEFIKLGINLSLRYLKRGVSCRDMAQETGGDVLWGGCNKSVSQYGKCLISTIIVLTNSGDVSLHFKHETFEKLFVRQNHVHISLEIIKLHWQINLLLEFEDLYDLELLILTACSCVHVGLWNQIQWHKLQIKKHFNLWFS